MYHSGKMKAYMYCLSPFHCMYLNTDASSCFSLLSRPKHSQYTHIYYIQEGIIIRTVAQRKGRTEQENTLIAKTKQCKVERIGPSAVQMTLAEGRNRQIRKMMEALGFTVVRLHRVEFMGIRLDRGLVEPGDWDYLDEEEMKLVKDALRSVQQDDDDDDVDEDNGRRYR